MNMQLDHFFRRASITLLLAWGFFVSISDAATVTLRLTDRDGVLKDYYEHPDAFPVCKKGVDYISFVSKADKLIRPDGQRLFDTTKALAEVFRGSARDRSFTGKETVDAIADYEAAGFNVKYVLVYREDWLMLNGSGGPWKEDIRILSEKELQNVREALKASNLKSKDSVKIIQLLGARSKGADSWSEIVKDPALMTHLEHFDGVGVECHVGDDDETRKKIGPLTLDCMALVTKWAKDKNKEGFIFMGGGPPSYITPDATQATYAYLWDKMAKLGVDKKDPHLIYYRQGGRPGVHLPEDGNSLTSQVKWLIETVKP